MKIRTKIFLSFLLSTAVSIALITGMLGWQLRKDALRSYEQMSSGALKQANNYIELFWQEAKKNIGFLAELPDAKESAGCFQNFSQKTEPTLIRRNDLDERGKRLFDLWQFVTKTHPDYAEIFYGYPDGSYGSSLETEMPGGFDSRKRAWFTEGMKSSELFTMSPAYRSFTGDLVAAVTCKIKKDALLVGFASIDVSLVSLTNLV